MAAATKTVTIRFNGDPSGLARASVSARQTVAKFGSGFAGTLKTAGAVAAGALGAAVFNKAAGAVKDFVSGSVTAFSDLNESVNAVNQIFGKSAGQIQAWGQKNANSLGLSTRAFNELAVPLGALLKNAGLPLTEVTKRTTQLTERAADMASVFNTDVSTALEAIQAGLRGESDPLEQFGVSLSAAKVDAEALAETGKKTAAKLTDQEKATARLNLIMKQTKATSGDFRNTSDGLANSQRIAAAKTEELQAKIGKKLAPVVQRVTQLKLKLTEVLVDKILPAFEKLAASPLADWIKGTLVPAFADFGKWLLKIGGYLVTGAKYLNKHRDVALALGIGVVAVLVPAFIAWAASAGAAAIATIAATAPILITIGVVAALAFGIIQLVKHWDTVWSAIKSITMTAVRAVVGAFLNLVGTIVSGAAKAFGWVPGLGGKLKNAAKDFEAFKQHVNDSLSGIKDKNVTIKIDASMTATARRLVGSNVSDAALRAALSKQIAISGRWMGGDVAPGRTYLVGERGPELLTLGRGGGGHITPNNRLHEAGSAPEVHVYIGDRELTDIVRVEVSERDRAVRRRVNAGVTR